VLGAERHERTDERLGYRNGSRPRLLTTQVGDIPLSIPKLRSGSFFPTILEPRRRIDQALYAVIMEAWVIGISTRKVDALVAAIGSQAGISRSEVSRICQGLSSQIQAFLERPLDGARTRTSTLTRPICTGGSARRCRSARVPLSWPWASMPTAAVSCLACRWVTAKASPSGVSSSAASSSAASLACAWWSPTPTWA